MIGKVGVFSRDWTLVIVLVLQLFFSYCVTDLQHFGFVDQVFTGQLLFVGRPTLTGH